MKVALVVFVTLTLVGCSRESPRLPTTPDSPAPTPNSLTWLWGMVVDETGLCIVGATVEVVAGHGVGKSTTQTTPCDEWDVRGFELRDLVPGVALTLRASAAGYADQEKTLLPSVGEQSAVIFRTSRIR